MNKLLLYLAVVFIYSCKTPVLTTQSTRTDQQNQSASMAADAILDSVMAHAFRFEYFSARVKVEVIENGDKTEFTANLRIRNDSLIWVSVSPALSVEVARLLVTRDSVFLIDRLNKERTSKGYDFFSKYTSLPINLETFQNLIEGNPLFMDADKDYQLIRNDTLLMLAAIDSAVTDTVIFDRNYLLYHQHLTDHRKGTLTTENKQYDIQYTTPFSLWRKISLYQKSEVTIEITFSKIKINEKLQFPFKLE